MKNDFNVAQEVVIIRRLIDAAIDEDPPSPGADEMKVAERKREVKAALRAGARLTAGLLMDVQSIAQSLRTIAHNTGLPVVQLAKLEPPSSPIEPGAIAAAPDLSS